MSWAAPTTGDPVTNYVLEGGSAPGLADYGRLDLGTAMSFTLGGVPDGTFWLRLRAANSAGTGPATAELALGDAAEWRLRGPADGARAARAEPWPATW